MKLIIVVVWLVWIALESVSMEPLNTLDGNLKTKLLQVLSLIHILLMLTIGYTTYAVILIRANANTPLNENAPGHIFTLKSYLNREQYESAPYFMEEHTLPNRSMCPKETITR